MTDKLLRQLIIAAVLLVTAIVTLFAAVDVVHVAGNQVGVRETWGDGVDPNSLPSRTYVCWPGESIYTYSTAVSVFTMSDRDDSGSYLVQSKDSQDMHLSFQVQWTIDPEHVVALHKNVGPGGIEGRIIRPAVKRIVKDAATTRQAIEAYSGDGLVQLQTDIQNALRDAKGELALRGIRVENFVFEHIRLDPKYVEEITRRQIAIQRELRARQEEKAAHAEAAKAKAVAQAGFETAVVDAKRDKEVQILKAQANQEQEILRAEGARQQAVLAAQGDREKAILAAQGEKEAGDLQAQAILALGKANAESERLKFSAFAAQGADQYARIEIAKALGASLSGIKGYLPQDMQVFTLGSNFMQAVENVAGGGKH